MATTLTAEQVTSVKRSSGNYKVADYRAAIDAVVASGASVGHVELDFPNVKPERVLFMLKYALKPEQNGGQPVTLPVEFGKSAEHGICIIHTGAADAKKKAA